MTLLKQANAVLGVAPKDLQNLLQFKVLRPSGQDRINQFDNRLLLEAKIVLYGKDSLGTSTDVLILFGRALSNCSEEHVAKARYLSPRSRPAKVGNQSRFESRSRRRLLLPYARAKTMKKILFMGAAPLAIDAALAATDDAVKCLRLPYGSRRCI